MRDLNTQPHVRFNPLRGEWVLVSPQRNDATVAGPGRARPPTRTRRLTIRTAISAREARGPADCDEPRLPLDVRLRQRLSGAARRHPSGGSSRRRTADRARRDRRVPGRVLFAAPRSHARADGSPTRCAAWSTSGRMRTRASAPSRAINYVQVFENRGAMMGASNPHPHGQIWATATIPNEPSATGGASPRIARPTARCLLCDYLALETVARRARGRARTRTFVAVVPFWAVWPFETLVLPRRHVAGSRRPDVGRTRRAGGHAQAPDDALRQPVRDAVSVLDGIPSAAVPTARRTTRGICTPTSIRRCCARRPCASSWSASRCSACRSAT